MTDKQNYFTYTDNTSNDKDKIMENLHKQIIIDGLACVNCPEAKRCQEQQAKKEYAINQVLQDIPNEYANIIARLKQIIPSVTRCDYVLEKQLKRKEQECERLENNYRTQLRKNIEKQCRIKELQGIVATKEFILKVNGKKYTGLSGIDKAKLFINSENYVRNKKILELEDEISGLQWKFYDNCKAVVNANNQLDQLKAVNEELKSENDKFKDMAKKGLDEYKDVGGCWGCGIQLSLDQVLLDYRKKEKELNEYKKSKQASYEALQKQCNELELENRKLKKSLDEKNKFLEQLGISASGEFKRIKYYIDKLVKENEELKTQLKTLDEEEFVYEVSEIEFQKQQKLKQTLAEIKEIVYLLNDRTMVRKDICDRLDLIQQKISEMEVLND